MTLTKGEEENAGRRETHPHQGPPPKSVAGENKFFARALLEEGRAEGKTRAAGKPTPTRGRRLKAARAKISYLPSFLREKAEKTG